MNGVTIKQLSESLKIPKFDDFPLQKVYTSLEIHSKGIIIILTSTH